MVISGTLSLVNLILGRHRGIHGVAAAFLIAACWFAGGSHVPISNDFPDHTPYIGLDWFILDLLGFHL